MWGLWQRTPEGQTMLKSSKKGLYWSWRKERARVVCEEKSPEGQNRAGRERFLWKGERRSSLKDQKRAESSALRLLSAVGSTWVPVTHVLEHRGRQMRGWRLIISRKHGWCCKLRCFLQQSRMIRKSARCVNQYPDCRATALSGNSQYPVHRVRTNESA